MEMPSQFQGKRKCPRVSINMPLDFQVTGQPNTSQGLVINASETGLLIQTFKDLPVGTRMNIVVLFTRDFAFGKFTAIVEIIWKDICLWEDWEGYQYGLKFAQILNEDSLKLKQILSNPSNLEGISLADQSK